MITIKNENLKSSKLNVLAGRDLVFDANGVCKDAPEDLAILVFPHAGMKVDGLSEKAKASAEKRKNSIEHAKRAQRKGGYQRGLPEPAHVTNPEPYRGVIGKEVGKPAPTNVGQKMSDDEAEAEALAKAEEEAILAVRTPPGDEGEFDTMEEREARLKAKAEAPAASGEVSEETSDEEEENDATYSSEGEESISEEESADAPKKSASSLKGKPKKKKGK